MNDIQALIEDFTRNLAAALESQALERARDAVESALGGRSPGPRVKPTRLASVAKPRKKPPVQFCPVPGCKTPAAPVFGMVCGKHRDISKTKIKKYREARKAQKLGTASAKTTKRRAWKNARPRNTAAVKPIASAVAA
jgi:hypothetical protein